MKTLLFLFVLFSSSFLVFAESLEGLESLQKQTADTLRSAGSASEDLMALDFLNGKLHQYFWLDYYPNKDGQMLSTSFRPRFHLTSALNPNAGAPLVPIREITKKRVVPGGPCSQAITPLPLLTPFLDNNFYCSDITSTKILDADTSALGSLQKMSDLHSPSEIQVGYISIPTKFPSDYLTNPNSQITRTITSLKSKRIQFLRFIPYPAEPTRVAFIEVQAGGTKAQIPYPEPAFINTPQCQVTTTAPVDGQCRSLFTGATCTSLSSANFSLFNKGGVVVSASFDGNALTEAEIPQQTVQEQKNELLKTISLSDLKSRMREIRQEPNSDYAQGLVQVYGEVRGPDMSLNPSSCQSSIAIRFYNPPSPQCTIALSSTQQEPDLPVTATVKIKNQTSSAVLVSSAGGIARNLNLNPAPTVSQEITTTTQMVKQGDHNELITVNLQGPGGSGSCQASLNFLRPAPPQCNLTASPSTVSACNPNTTLTLDCVNRVHSASINGIAVTIDAQGKASIPYTKAGLGSVTVKAEARNRWWPTPSTPHVAIGDNTIAPTCTLAASTSDVMVGQSTTLTLSNVQGCFNANQIDINGTPVTLTGGQASLSYTKQNTNAETLVAHIRGPAGLLGTCPVPLTGFPIPKPTCTLTASRTSLAFGESTTISLSHQGQVTDGEVYINGKRGITDTYKKESCGDVVVKGYVVGPGGQSDECTVAISHNTPTPQCTFTATPTEGLQTGASVTASLSCSNGQYVKNVRLFDEDRTDEIKSSGTASKVFANLSAGTHNVVADVHDACDREILNKNIPLHVATPPPACAFMRENEWVNMHSIYQGKPRYVIGNLNRDVTSNLTTGSSDLELGFYTRKGFMGDSRWEGTNNNSIGKDHFEVADRSHPMFEDGVVWLGRTVRRHNGNPYDGDAGTSSEWRTGDGGNFNLLGRGGDAGPVLDRHSYNCRTMGAIDWNGPHATLQHSDFTSLYDCFDANNNKLYLTSYRKFADGREKTFLTAEIKNTHLASCEISKIVVDRVGGCFTADTAITMANGREKRVSEIRENEYVFNPHYRTGIRVKKVVKGPEPKPLFEVALNGKKIKVTEDHPFFTERGWVQTQALKKGDKLFGEGKGKVVESVRKLPYQKPVDVWNFELDTEDPLAHIVMANGIPTGDLVTQLGLKKPGGKLP